MAKKDDIDWDDPVAVAAARGDNPDDDDKARENLHRTEAEQKEIDDKAAADKTTDDAASKKADDEAAAAKVLEDERTAAYDKLEEGPKAVFDKLDDDGKTAFYALDETAQTKLLAGEEDDTDAKGNMIPKSRLDAKTRQNKALQDRIDAFERDRAADAVAAKNDDARTVIETELATLDKAINKAISDDKMEEAAELRGEVRTKERELWQMDMDESSDNATTDAREAVRLDMAIDHIESTHEEFDPESDNYSQEVVDKVQELRNGFVATGKYTPTQALLRAMDFVLPKKAVKDINDAADDPATKLKKEEELRKAGLKKATDAAGKQPADTKKVGDDADTAGIQDGINIDKLSYEDVASLPEATLKRMRGDTPA
jgi:hypothetical protein